MSSSPSLELPVRAQGAGHLRATFAGVEFAVEGDDALLEQVRSVPLLRIITEPVATDRETQPHASGRLPSVQLRLREMSGCELESLARSLGARELRCDWGETRGSALTRHAHAEWRVVSTGFDVEARLTATSRSAESLLTALAAAVVHRAGGAVLHAASVELPLGVVALIGPSGAGKSTACRQIAGARPFSIDRLAVAPAGPLPAGKAHWCAAPLPGGSGTAAALPRTEAAQGKPLALVARVYQTSGPSWIVGCSRTEAVATLRACAFHAGSGAAAELELLAQLERLAADIPFANLHVQLGAPLAPLLDEWLSKGREERSAGVRARRGESDLGAVA